MWTALLGACGYVPLPLTGTDYLELLPVRFHPVTGRGIRINYRTYDHAVLNEHRGRPCPTHPGASGKSTSTRSTCGRSTSACPTGTCTRSPGSTATTSTPR
ncbi:hypothetical protein QA943_41020 [Streptomyces sp. B21-097]|uniref:hypothetical protein n=1 Tax=Streptomyces sp. B21-097 TaxID=3039414 RepID=UPI002FF2C65E